MLISFIRLGFLLFRKQAARRKFMGDSAATEAGVASPYVAVRTWRFCEVPLRRLSSIPIVVFLKAKSESTAFSFFAQTAFAVLFAVLLGACSDQKPSVIDHALLTVSEDQKREDSGDLAGDLGVPIVQKPSVGNPVRVSVPGSEWSDANLLIRLEGEVSSLSDAAIVKTRWRQVAGPEATIMSPDDPSTQVLLPDVDAPVDVSFRLSAVDEAGYANSARTTITLLPVRAPFRVANVAGAEGGGELVFAIRLAVPAASDLTFSYETADGSARSGQDYEATLGTVTVPRGKSSATVVVPLLDDSFREAAESFTLLVTGDYEGIAVAAHVLGVIVDNETGPLALYAPPLAEGPSDKSQVQLAGHEGVVRFHLEWADGSSGLNLRVTDPCGNALSESLPEAACQQAVGAYSQSAGAEALPSEASGWANNAPEGVFTVELEHTDGLPTDYVLRVFLGGESQMFSGRLGDGEVSAPLHFEFAGAAPVYVQAVGAVIDAVSAQPIEARVIVRRTEAEPVLLDVLTDDEGRFEFPLEAGTYYFEIIATGYIGWHETVTFAAGSTSTLQPALSPEFVGQAARIVLQWGKTPADLDAHLEGPLPSGGRFHIYFSHPLENGVAELDVDDTDSFGPETITIFSLMAGTYQYRVQDYSNTGATESTALAESNAVVKVFTEDGRELTFKVPDQAGTEWSVFEIDGVSGVITPINTMSQ